MWSMSALAPTGSNARKGHDTLVLVIGLTGNVASGKSSVAGTWESMGAVIIDADRIGHDMLKPGSDAFGRLLETFGDDLIGGGEVDRKKLSERVFNDPGALRRLNCLVHPLIRDRIERRLLEEEEAGTSLVVIDAALICEAGMQDRVDVLVVVHAPLGTRLARLKEKRGLSEEESLRIERMQMDPADKASRGDYVLENNGTLETLQQIAAELLTRIMKERGLNQKGVDAGE